MECQPLGKINEAAISANQMHVELELHGSRNKGFRVRWTYSVLACEQEEDTGKEKRQAKEKREALLPPL